MLYAYLKNHIYWHENKRAKFKAFHVTPYINEILAKGELLPPSTTGKSVLGENVGQRTIRGCLLSFFEDFQTAMNGCYTLALYAILEKNLLTNEELEALLRMEISRHGINDAFFDLGFFEDSLDDEALNNKIINFLLMFYQSRNTRELFSMLGAILEPFKNPVILTNKWVKDLPNDINSILNAIGVIEIEVDRKYIADPSTPYNGFKSQVYGYAESKGNFGVDLSRLDLIEDDVFYDDESASRAMGYASTQIAHYINRVCRTTSAELSDNNVEEALMDTYEDFDEFENVQTQYGESWVFDDLITFVSKVTINPQDLVIWNPEEHEWRIPIPNGIKVDASNVVALASEVQLATSKKPNEFDTLIYIESEIRGRRKNPK